VVQNLETKVRTVLVRGGSDARYLPSGHLIFALGTTLFAVPLDTKKMEVRGNPVPVVEGVLRAAAINTAAAHFGFSNSGSLFYVPSTGGPPGIPQRTLASVDQTGKAQTLALPPQFFSRPRVSPNGSQLTYATDDGRESIVWILDLRGNAQPRRLTFGGRNLNPVWSHDAQFVSFTSNREGDWGLFQQRADGGGTAERLVKAIEAVQHVPESASPDGKTLIYRLNATGINASGVMSLTTDGEKKSAPLLASPSTSTTQANVAFSPDGRWVAYDSNEPDGGNFHVFVQPFPPTGAKFQLPDLGLAPVWSRDGKQIIYAAGGTGTNRIGIVDITTMPTFAFGKSTSFIVPGLIGNNGTNRNFDVTRDGQLIAVVDYSAPGVAPGKQPPLQINVVLNWFEELNQRVPVR
jgi:Tol biopolymer transport system component